LLIWSARIICIRGGEDFRGDPEGQQRDVNAQQIGQPPEDKLTIGKER
jgi:hypothetical protein